MFHSSRTRRVVVAVGLCLALVAGMPAVAGALTITPIPQYGIDGLRVQLGNPSVRTDKVFSVPVATGDYVYAALQPGSYFDLGLMNTPSIAPTSTLIDGLTRFIWFRAPSAATYYVDVACAATSTVKAEDLFMYRARSLVKWSTPSTFVTPYYTARTISASIGEYYAAPNTIIPDTLVDVHRSDDGVHWVKVGSTRTDYNGVAKWTVKEKRRAFYRFKVVEDAEFWVAPAVSTVRTVMPKASLTIPSAPTSYKHGVTFSSVGYLKPRHTPGTYPVKVKAWRWTGTKWSLVYTFKGKASDYNGNTKYVAKVNLVRTGKWRLRAEHEDSKHALTKTGYRYVTIK